MAKKTKSRKKREKSKPAAKELMALTKSKLCEEVECLRKLLGENQQARQAAENRLHGTVNKLRDERYGRMKLLQKADERVEELRATRREMLEESYLLVKCLNATREHWYECVDKLADALKEVKELKHSLRNADTDTDGVSESPQDYSANMTVVAADTPGGLCSYCGSALHWRPDCPKLAKFVAGS